MRFFTDSEEVSEVVWYRVPDDRPFLPVPTIFASYEWVEYNRPWDRWPGTAGLGEQVSSPRSFPGRPVPPAGQFRGTFCGTPEQWAGGMLLPDPPIELQDNLLPACCGAPVSFLPDPFRRDVALAFARSLDALYDEAPSDPMAPIEHLLPTDRVFTIVRNADNNIFPGSNIIVTRDYAIVEISGTSTPWQLAIQAANQATQLPDLGGFRSTVIWRDAANVIRNRMIAAGVDPNLPIMYVRHSYGGVIACILAAQDVQTGHTDRSILTYGTPKPGDENFRALLHLVYGRHLVNDNDPVPRTPPNQGELTPVLMALVPFRVQGRWALFEPPPQQWGLSEGGVLYFGPTQNLGDTLPDLIPLMLNGTMPEPFAHQMKEYIRRLALSP